MHPRLFNVYYIFDGEQNVTKNHYLSAAMSWARTILEQGGEITSIIDAEHDG